MAEDLLRHAVGAAEVAAVRDRDAQIAERPAEGVENLRHLEQISVWIGLVSRSVHRLTTASLDHRACLSCSPSSPSPPSGASRSSRSRTRSRSTRCSRSSRSASRSRRSTLAVAGRRARARRSAGAARSAAALAGGLLAAGLRAADARARADERLERRLRHRHVRRADAAARARAASGSGSGGAPGSASCSRPPGSALLAGVHGGSLGGDLLVLGGAAVYSLQIVLMERYAPRYDALGVHARRDGRRLRRARASPRCRRSRCRTAGRCGARCS